MALYAGFSRKIRLGIDPIYESGRIVGSRLIVEEGGMTLIVATGQRVIREWFRKAWHNLVLSGLFTSL